MKKVGILTINDDNNYGNRLQNYAVQEFCKKNDIVAETIHNQEGIVGINVYKKRIKNFIKKFLNKDRFVRYNLFMKFNKKFIKYSKFYIDKNNINEKINNEYDTFITGSDQVWNPNFGRMSDIDFLTFVDKTKKNSFSASFGISEIPENMKKFYKERLDSMNCISVREEKGKEIIEQLTGRTDVEVLVDPTMLLTADEWDKVAKKPKMLKSKKFILNYFLGELSDKRKSEIERVAIENECEIINILDKNSPFYKTGPSEFLYLEKNAFLICTDSFHSCVFAILYNKPFIVFDREDDMVKMNSRIENLISKFNLKNRKFEVTITKENLNHDYKNAYKILKDEREKTQNFLKRILNQE